MLVGFSKCGESSYLRIDFGSDTGERVAQTQHHRGVDDILAGQPAMQPLSGLAVCAFAQQCHQPDNRVAVGLGTRRDGLHITDRHQRRQVRAALDRCHACVDKRAEPRVFDLDHRRQER